MKIEACVKNKYKKIILFSLIAASIIAMSDHDAEDMQQWTEELLQQFSDEDKQSEYYKALFEQTEDVDIHTKKANDPTYAGLLKSLKPLKTTCLECGMKTFHLKDHAALHHEICRSCTGYPKFPSRQALHDHCASNHSHLESLVARLSSPKKEEVENKGICPYCGIECRYQLNRHLALHHEICYVCTGYPKFPSRQVLYDHWKDAHVKEAYLLAYLSRSKRLSFTELMQGSRNQETTTRVYALSQQAAANQNGSEQ